MRNELYIVDDHKMLLRGLKDYLEEHTNWKCPYIFTNKTECLEKLKEIAEKAVVDTAEKGKKAVKATAQKSKEAVEKGKERVTYTVRRGKVVTYKAKKKIKHINSKLNEKNK